MSAGVKNRSDKAYEYIRGQLLLGQLQAGSRVSDALLATEMGISRTPVREALIRLENEGLVEQVPRVGIFVRVPKLRELLDSYELRRLLECHAVGKAARRISGEQLERMRALCDELHDLAREIRRRKLREMPQDLGQRGVLADVAFHMLILEVGGNRQMMQIVANMHLMSQLMGHNRDDYEEYTLLRGSARTFHAHYRIYKALVRRDASMARYWMRKHLGPLRKSIVNLRRLHCRLADAEFADWPESLRDTIREMERSKISENQA